MTAGSEMVGSYNAFLVCLCIVIAVFASYTALDLAKHVTGERGMARVAWLTCGTTAMAIGIWSMHYVGMFAFKLPVSVLYHWPTALLALVAAFVSSAVALLVVTRHQMRWFWIWIGGLFQGSAIASLHYIAMASMRMQAMAGYSPAIVVLSVLVAILGSVLSLWLSFRFRLETTHWKWRKIAGAVTMGAAAIAIMHYTGMAAVSYKFSADIPDFAHAVRVSYLGVAGVVAVSLIVSVASVVTGLIERLQRQNALFNELFEHAPQATALIDAEGRVIRVNKEFTRLFAYSPQEACGRRLPELIVPEDSQSEFERRMESVTHGDRAEDEVVFGRRSEE